MAGWPLYRAREQGARLKPSEMNHLYEDAKSRFSKRDAVGHKIRRIASNEFDDETFSDLVMDSSDQPVVANLISSGARLLAQRLGLMPRISVLAERPGDAATRRAEKHEADLRKMLDVMDWPSRQTQAAYWQVLHDHTVATTLPGKTQPFIRIRDPLHHYPQTFLPEVTDQRHLFVADLDFDVAQRIIDFPTPFRPPSKVTLVECFAPDGVHIWTPTIKDADVRLIENPCEGSLVSFASGFISEQSPQGQFDHTIGALFMQARLQHLVVQGAASQVHAGIYIVGDNPIITSNDGNLAEGAGAVNIISNGQVQMPVKNISPQVFSEIDRMERAVRLAGGYPTQLSGEPAGSYVTGRGTEALMTQVDDNINYHRTLLSRMLRGALRKVADLSDAMKLDNNIQPQLEVEVRFQSGADPASTIRMLQLQGAGYLSSLSVMNQLPEVLDAQAEMIEVEVEQLRKAALAKVGADITQGGLTASQIAEVIASRRKGKPLEEAIAAMEAAAAENMAAMPTQEEFAGALLGGPGQPSQSARLAAPVPGGSQQFSQTRF